MAVEKSADAFRTISEVADELQVPQHVLRFWEGRFPQIKPVKRAGGRRYYRPGDVALLAQIRDMLYKQGLTIKDVQAALKDGTIAHGGGDEPADATEAQAVADDANDGGDEDEGDSLLDLSLADLEREDLSMFGEAAALTVPHSLDLPSMPPAPSGLGERPVAAPLPASQLSLLEPTIPGLMPTIAAPRALPEATQVQLQAILAELEQLRHLLLTKN